MEVTKYKLIQLTRLVIMAGILMGTVSTVLFTYLHIKMLPIIISIYPQEIILFVSIAALYLFSRRHKIKYSKIIGSTGLILGMINLVGFKIVIKLLMRG